MVVSMSFISLSLSLCSPFLSVSLFTLSPPSLTRESQKAVGKKYVHMFTIAQCAIEASLYDTFLLVI